MSKSHQILKRFWGYDSFRLGQEEIINDSINGKDVLALLPTGGGKSICFQVPGLIREGITIVVSPLIALMQDQVNNLNARGIKAKAIISGMSYRDIDITLDNARFGGLNFLYTSPERIQSQLFIERFKLMNVGLIVVDEAHCISEWGHDFRPSFKEIKKLREFHTEVPIMAVTATATKKTQDDIIEQLQLRNVQVHQSSFERDNLVYQSFKTNNKLDAILSTSKEHINQTGIVYCQTRKSVKFVANQLHAAGIKVGIYHGGMEKNERKQMLTAWLNNDILVMVATNAFGMGIDKPDVRFVLHYEFPNSLEAYFQEAGRGGRDGNLSHAINYWEEADIGHLKSMLELTFPPLDFIKRVYRAICNHLKIAIGNGNGETYELDIAKLCKAFELPVAQTYSAIKFLEIAGELFFTEGIFQPTRVKYAVGNTALYNFQIQHEKFVPITTLLSRSYPGIFDYFSDIHEEEFCKRLDINPKELENQLKFLEKYGIIDITWKSNLPKITFLRERMPDDYLQLRPEIYRERKLLAEQKLAKGIDFLKLDKCRSMQLIEYFGIETTPCGKCDVCLKNSSAMTLENTIAEIQVLVQKGPQSPFELRNLFPNHDLFQQALRILVKDEKILLQGDLYCWIEQN